MAQSPWCFCSPGKTNKMNYLQYIQENLATKAEIDVFLNELSWAQFDPEIGYTLGNYMPHDGLDNSSTLSTSKSSGARTSFMYADKPCRINTYGNSFTQGHQVSDGETWQEYLAAHLGEPLRNFGMGGLGVYQAYRRMIREENTENNAQYLIFYIWGDDHIRSLLRCRYMLFKEWKAENEPKEGVGKMFHGNFWANLEMELSSGQFQEKDSLISLPQNLYKMTDPAWMVENLKDDLALQMYLFKQTKIDEIDIPRLKTLSAALKFPVDLENVDSLQESISNLLDQYGFAATKYILHKARDFAAKNDKKLMIVLFDPYHVTKTLLESGTRYDQEIVAFLQENHFNYFDMNLCHVADYKDFNLSIEDYFKRYFIGHYSPAGNHFFAFSIKPQVVEWLDPQPVTYQKSAQKMIDFNGYLNGMPCKNKK
jgi:hypothetical protein